MLDPEFWDHKHDQVHREVMEGLLKMLERLLPDPEKQQAALTQLAQVRLPAAADERIEATPMLPGRGAGVLVVGCGAQLECVQLHPLPAPQPPHHPAR